MTAGRHEWAGRSEEFDYDAMAGEALKCIGVLKKGLARLKGRAPAVPGPGDLLHSRILLLEEELMEQRSLYKLFCRKAAERKEL